MPKPNLMVRETPFPHPYKPVAGVQSFALGGGYSVGIKIEVATPHTLSQDEAWDIQDAANKMLNDLRRGAEKADPVAVARQEAENKELLGIFPYGCGIKEIPNEYNPAVFVNPWFLVYTTRGPIKIGWRKRVINIDWSESLIKEDGATLFPDEDVTKGHHGEKYVHAWSVEKAYEYVQKLLDCKYQFVE